MSRSASATSFDAAKAEAFAGSLMATLNHGATCLMISLGHRSGLFDAMRDQPPLTSAELSERSGLNERYVREWLGAMATAHIVEVAGSPPRFHLPAEHAAFVTRAAGNDNIAVFTQYVALLGGVEDDVLACFHQGGGVPYERYPRFHEVMAEDSAQSIGPALEPHILPLVPGLEARLRDGIRVLDLGCGRGRTLLRLGALFPKSRFTGYDLSPDAVEAARAEARQLGLANVSFEVVDLSDFDEKAEPGAWDWITTFDAVHDQAQPRRMLRGIHRALAADGVYLMQDIRGSSHVEKNLDHPLGPFLYTVSCMHCMTVSLAQGGEGVGAMWGEEMARDFLREAGFGTVEKHRLAHDIQNDWYVVRK